MQNPVQRSPGPDPAIDPGGYRRADVGGLVARGQRIGDVERSAVCEELSAHFAAGRLSDEDLEYRLTMAVHAVTGEDLHRLTMDLPSAGTALPTAGPPPGTPSWPPGTPIGPAGISTRRTWPAVSVLAVLALIGSVCVAGGLLMALGLYQTWLFLGAFIGGSAAALGGASATYLIMTHLRLRRPGE